MSVYMLYSRAPYYISYQFVKHGLVYLQAIVDEWASSLFRVCVGLLIFSPGVYLIAWWSSM